VQRWWNALRLDDKQGKKKDSQDALTGSTRFSIARAEAGLDTARRATREKTAESIVVACEVVVRKVDVV
jgi:hypothetical protein